MQHLVGQKLPDAELPSSVEDHINPGTLTGRAVYFIYPYTGKAGHPDPENWDHIAGAHGSTLQALTYAKLHDEFFKSDVKIFGLSLLSPEWQRDFSVFHQLPYALLSDHKRLFTKKLNLPLFKTGGRDFLARLTIIAHDGFIRHVRFPVSSPQDDASECLMWWHEQS